MPPVTLATRLERTRSPAQWRPLLLDLAAVRRPAVVGLLAMLTLVISAGQAATPVGVVLERSFGGLLHASSTGGTVSSVAVVVALATLLTCWWRVLRLAADGKVGLPAVAGACGLWLLPVLIGPPLLSLDAYAYLAQGSMLAGGLDPYTGGPVLLGDDPAIARVDPMWRASPAPYGPLALLLFRAAAVTHGDLVTGVLLLRVIALLGVAAAVAVALRLAVPSRRPYVLALCALNPVTLVHLIGGAHIDAVLAGVLGLSLLALLHNRPWLSWTLAASAAALKITAAPLLLFLLIELARGHPVRARAILRATGLAALPFAATLVVVDRPWGFLGALAVPGTTPAWYAPATVAGNLLAGAGDLLSVPVDDNVLLWAGRLAVMLAGALVVLAILRAEYHDDELGRSRRTVQRAALALMVVSLCLPAVHAWYLAAGLFVLAAVGTQAWTRLIVVLSSALIFSSLPTLYAANPWAIAAAWCVALSILIAGSSGLRRATTAVSGRVAATAQEAASTAHRGWLRLAQAAGVGLLAAGAVGLLSPGASADEAGKLERSERVRVVNQLARDYPDLQIVSVLPSAKPGTAYTAQLVEPTGRTCRLVLARGIGPYAEFVRLKPRATAQTGPDAIDVCPPPVGPEAREESLDMP